jgi:hypothetical protein
MVIAMLIIVQIASPTTPRHFKSPALICHLGRLLVQRSGQASGVLSKSLISRFDTAHGPHPARRGASTLLSDTDTSMNALMNLFYHPASNHRPASNALLVHSREVMQILRVISNFSQKRRLIRAIGLMLLPCARAFAWSLLQLYPIVFEPSFPTQPLTPYNRNVLTQSSEPMITLCLRLLLEAARPSSSSSLSVELLRQMQRASIRWFIKRRQKLCAQSANVTGKPNFTKWDSNAQS